MAQLKEDFLIELAKACLVSGEVLDVVIPHLQYSYLPNEPYKHIYKYLIDYHAANKKPPTLGMLAQNVTQKDTLAIIGKIREVNVYDSKQQIIETFETYIRNSQFFDLHAEAAELFNKGKQDEAIKTLADKSKSINEFSLKSKMHARVFHDYDTRQQKRRERDYTTIKVPTGIPQFDYHTRGGWDHGTGLLGLGKSGAGKAQPLYSRIYTPDGYTTMGNIKIGDFVLSENGEPISVLGTFNQGIRRVYKIKFYDGAEVDCDEDHLWKVYTANDRKRVSNSLLYKSTSILRGTHSILRTKDMIGNEMIKMRSNRDDEKNYKMPICKALQFTQKHLDIPPYALGALLGDGCMSNQAIISADQEILDRVENELNAKLKRKSNRQYTYRLNNCHLQRRLTKIFNGKSYLCYNKFIPKDYLYSSVEDRVNLLRGLMDTDGYVSLRGIYSEFCTSSKQLCDDIIELVNGLGGLASIGRTVFPQMKADRKILSKHKSYKIRINMPPNINPFFLKRKAERVVAKTKYITPRYIESITYIGQMETKCILVDGPTHLYITDGCVVTHNTTFLRSLGGNAAFRGINVLHIAAGDSTQEEVEDGYDAWWTGVAMNSIREGKIDGADYKKIEKAKQAWLANCGEIYIHVFKQFHQASIMDCRKILIDLLKQCDIGVVLFDYLEKFKPGDGKRYGTNEEGGRVEKMAIAEKIINIATEFNVATATVTQASNVAKEYWNNPKFVLSRENISNLKATIDPFAYCVTLNQTEDENDNEVMRIHEEKLRHYKIFSHSSTYHIAQKRDVGRFIDVERTKQLFWDAEKKQIIRDIPKA